MRRFAQATIAPSDVASARRAMGWTSRNPKGGLWISSFRGGQSQGRRLPGKESVFCGPTVPTLPARQGGTNWGYQSYKPGFDGRLFSGNLSGACFPFVSGLRAGCFPLVIGLPGLAASLSQTCRSLSASCRQLVFDLDCVPQAPLREDV